MTRLQQLRRGLPYVVIGLVGYMLGTLPQSPTIESPAAVLGPAPAHAAALASASSSAPPPQLTGIRKFTQHFNQPDADLAPWMLVPADNIRDFSTSRHPGLATIYEAGRGQDIKGL